MPTSFFHPLERYGPRMTLFLVSCVTNACCSVLRWPVPDKACTIFHFEERSPAGQLRGGSFSRGPKCDARATVAHQALLAVCVAPRSQDASLVVLRSPKLFSWRDRLGSDVLGQVFFGPVSLRNHRSNCRRAAVDILKQPTEQRVTCKCELSSRESDFFLGGFGSGVYSGHSLCENPPIRLFS